MLSDEATNLLKNKLAKRRQQIAGDDDDDVTITPPLKAPIDLSPPPRNPMFMSELTNLLGARNTGKTIAESRGAQQPETAKKNTPPPKATKKVVIARSKDPSPADMMSELKGALAGKGTQNKAIKKARKIGAELDAKMAQKASENGPPPTRRSSKTHGSSKDPGIGG